MGSLGFNTLSVFPGASGDSQQTTSRASRTAPAGSAPAAGPHLPWCFSTLPGPATAPACSLGVQT